MQDVGWSRRRGRGLSQKVSGCLESLTKSSASHLDSCLQISVSESPRPKRLVHASESHIKRKALHTYQLNSIIKLTMLRIDFDACESCCVARNHLVDALCTKITSKRTRSPAHSVSLLVESRIPSESVRFDIGQGNRRSRACRNGLWEVGCSM